MRLHALLVLGVGLLLAADAPKKDATKKEMAKFQGTWTFVSMEVNGKQQPSEDFNKYTVVLKDDQWTVSEGDKIAAKVTFKPDPTKKPKTIDLVDVEKKRLIRGIYSFERDTLTVCDRGAEKGDRPTEFGTKPDSGVVLFVLKRAKPSEPNGAAKKELAKFQGNWKFVSMEVNGKKSSEEEFGKFRVVYEGDGCKVYDGDKIAAEVTSIKLDPTKKPKTIDWTNQGRQVRGIYTLEEETLTLCDRETAKGDRPTKFATKSDSGLVLVVLKRVKP
jgi:uncharacterized protein (TIGR03067 family)